MRRVLLIYHSNICNKNCGINSYLYNICEALKRKGFVLDMFVPESFDANWETVEKDLIDNVFLKKDLKVIHNKSKIETSKGIFFKIVRRVIRFFDVLKEKIRKKQVDRRGKLDWITDDVIKRFKKVLEKNKYDYVVFSYVYYSKLVEYIPGDILKICSVNDFVSVQEMQHGNFKFGEVIEEEINAIKKFDKAIYISSDEMTFFSNFAEDTDSYYLPHYLNVNHIKNRKDVDILFIGSDNIHNVDAINWFLNNVYPKIITKNYKTMIVGKIISKINKDLYPSIEFVSYVEDLNFLYSRVKLVISPLKSGTGVKIKIIEAMTHGIPIVCTRKSLIGFIEKTDNGCIIADDSKEFSEAIDMVLASEVLREKLSSQAIMQCEKYYNKKYAEKILNKIFL